MADVILAHIIWLLGNKQRLDIINIWSAEMLPELVITQPYLMLGA